MTMTEPLPCPRCGKPLFFTATTSTELLTDAQPGNRHSVQSVVHCEDGHQVDFGPLAPSTAFRRYAVDRPREFSDPPPSREAGLITIIRRLRRGDRIYRRVAPHYPADGSWRHLAKEFVRDAADPLEPEMAALMDEIEPLEGT